MLNHNQYLSLSRIKALPIARMHVWITVFSYYSNLTTLQHRLLNDQQIYACSGSFLFFFKMLLKIYCARLANLSLQPLSSLQSTYYRITLTKLMLALRFRCHLLSRKVLLS
jgi:hypothetical protein